MCDLKKRSPWLYLLIIPIAVLLAFLLVVLGSGLDMAMTTPGGQGHGIPFFSALGVIIGAILLVFAFVISSVLFVTAMIRNKRLDKIDE